MGLTNDARRELAYKLIRDWQWEHGYAPTYRELAEELGCTVAVAHHHVRTLIREGRVSQADHRARTLRVTA